MDRSQEYQRFASEAGATADRSNSESKKACWLQSADSYLALAGLASPGNVRRHAPPHPAAANQGAAITIYGWGGTQ